MRKVTAALAVIAAGAIITGCGGAATTTHRHAPKTATAPAAASAPEAADPFAGWSAPCRAVAGALEDVGFAYMDGGWMTPQTDTWGDMVALAAGSGGADGQGGIAEADDLAHNSYVESTLGNEEAADAMTAASSAVFSYLPPQAKGTAAQYDTLMGEETTGLALDDWVNSDLMPVLNDCADGTG